VIDWMVSADAPSLGEAQLAHLLELGRLVIEQDGRACELNQMGLRSRRHREGVLVPQEHGVWEFHEWLRGRLGVASARTT
jgi:Rieske 2Fe-2S family protein